MADHTPSLMLIPRECIPEREAVEAFAPYGSIIFPDEHQVYEASVFNKYDVKVSGDRKNATLVRLLRGVGVFRDAISAQEEEPTPEEAKRMLAAADIQEGIIKDIGGAITGMARKGIGLLEASYILDDFINARDQQKHAELSKAIADDARFYYALQAGGELPMQAPVEEMVLDYGEQLEDLDSSINTHRLAMERLRFEWLTASVVINAVREDGSPMRYNRALRKGFRLD